MAEFLVKAVDATHADPEKSIRGCYRRGDIVQVYADGACTEAPAPDSRFYILKVPGFSPPEQYDEALKDADKKPLQRARWAFNFDALTDQQRDTLVLSKMLTLDSLDGLLIEKVAV